MTQGLRYPIGSVGVLCFVDSVYSKLYERAVILFSKSNRFLFRCFDPIMFCLMVKIDSSRDDITDVTAKTKTLLEGGIRPLAILQIWMGLGASMAKHYCCLHSLWTALSMHLAFLTEFVVL